MIIPSKKKILVDFFNQGAQKSKLWQHYPINKLSGRTPYDVLHSDNDEAEAVDYLFRILEAGIFDQVPPSKSLTACEKTRRTDIGRKSVD